MLMQIISFNYRLTVCRFIAVFFIAALLCGQVNAQTNLNRTLSGVVTTDKNETIADATIIVRTVAGEQKTTGNATGNFTVLVPSGALTIRGEDAGIRATGLDVLDLSERQRIRSWVDFNFSVDNLTNKRYFETQNYFESVVRPDAPVIARIHGTPGYSIGVTAGLTFHLFGK